VSATSERRAGSSEAATALTTRIAIIGGGLSGLYAASLLEQQGIKDYMVFEARDRFGGRIHSASASCLPASTVAATPYERGRFDLGPAWYWPSVQPQLDRLIRELGLERFPQYDAGDAVIEPGTGERPTRAMGYASSPTAMRLVGSMAALTDALRRRANQTRLMSGQRVRTVRCQPEYLELDVESGGGRAATCRAERLLLAVPPRLAVASIDFVPALPEGLSRQWKDAATWMAPHAKYLALYDTPFWREKGLSGDARSGRGPLAEVHDASTPEGGAALFGFFGVPANARRSVEDDVLKSRCRAQLGRLFGAQAATPRFDVIKDWASDPYTATAEDQNGIAFHGAAPMARAEAGIWRNRLVGIASEWSPQFPGYVAGAIEAAILGLSAALESATGEAT